MCSDFIIVSLSSSSLTDRPLVPSYTAAILRQLQYGAGTICRSVRKSLFKHGIWRPRHPPYPAGKHQTTSSPRPIPTLITNRTGVPRKLRDRTCTLSNLHTVPLHRWQLPRLAVINARSLEPKSDELSVILRTGNIEVAAVSEVWLKDHIPDQAITINGYSSFRHDRPGTRKGGGVILYICDSPHFRTKLWTELTDENVESVWVTVFPQCLLKQFTCLTFAAIYHPPDADQRVLQSHITHAIDHIRQAHPQSGLMLCGDFNKFPDSHLTKLCQLKQIVTNPTRRNNILDKIYTKMDMLHRLPVVMPPLGSSDHHVVTCEPTISSQFSTGDKVIVNTRVMGPNERAMFSMELRNFNWFAMYNMVSFNEQFAFFKETLNNLLDKHFPPKSVIRHSSDKPWVNYSFRFVIRRRQRAYMQGDAESYNRYRNKVNRMAKSPKTEYHNNKVASLKHVNPSRWWREVKELTSSMPSGGVSSL